MPAAADPTLLLIDASGWLFRAFHGLPPLTSPAGVPTGAVFGFANMLKRLYRDLAVERIAVVFDHSSESFRNALYADYKANRTETPPDLLVQFPQVLELVKLHGLPVLMEPDVEADDVIGTLAKEGEKQGLRVLVVTSDKDMAQLVNERVQLLDTMKNRTMDAAGVMERYGVRPDQMVDFLALMGDTSDNIPGVPGVGEKTAAKLLAEHGTLDAVMAAAPTVKGKLGENLRGALETLPLGRQLATIKCDVPLKESLDELVKGPADPAALHAFYKRMGFGRLAEEAAVEVARAASGDATAAPAATPAAREPNDGGDPTTFRLERHAAPPTSNTGAADDAGIPIPLKAGESVRPPSTRTRPRLVLDRAALDEMVAALAAAPLICFDTETDSLDSNQCRMVGMAFAVTPGEGWYVPLAHDYLGSPEQLPLADAVAAVKPLLEDPAIPKLAQHGKFDCNVLVRHGIAVQGLAYDTMLESYVLDAGSNRHDMDTLAEKHLEHITIKFADVAGKGKGQLTFNQVEVHKAAEYSAEDADITLRLHQKLHPEVAAAPALERLFREIEMPLVPVLAGMEQRGVRVDVGLLERIGVELGQRMEQLQREAWVAAEQEFNIGSPKQLAELLYGKLKLPVLGRTPKGEPGTGEDVLEELAAQHPLPKLILDWRSLSKLRGTYTENLVREVNPRTGRIHTSYHQAVAATGRLSSSDPNLQNIPVRTAEGRRIRQAFVPEPGMLLCSIDYSQIELRLMAHFSGDKKLIDAFNQGLDIHQATAAEANGVPLAEVTGDMRRAAKAINFGLIYGISSFGLAKQLAIGRSEAQGTIDRFFDRYPGVRAFMEGSKQSARIKGYVETMFGRRLGLPNILSRNQGLRSYAERLAINAPLQGTAADLIKVAMLDVADFLAAELPEVRLILQVHDELVFEAPEAILREAAPRLAEQMVKVLHRGLEGRPAPISVPLQADFGLGMDWDSSHNATGHAQS